MRLSTEGRRPVLYVARPREAVVNDGVLGRPQVLGVSDADAEPGIDGDRGE
jgi:hypothetical protein